MSQRYKPKSLGIYCSMLFRACAVRVVGVVYSFFGERVQPDEVPCLMQQIVLFLAFLLSKRTFLKSIFAFFTRLCGILVLPARTVSP